jgi:hypothetical protein
MKRRRGILTAAMIVVVLAFVVGLVQLIVYRLQTGPSYPPYSSLRADPRGTRALAESFERMPHLRVTRNYNPLPRELPPPEQTTLMYLGVRDPSETWEDPNRIRQPLDAFVREGGRLVVTLALPPWAESHPPAAAPEEIETDPDTDDFESGWYGAYLAWVPGNPPRFVAHDAPIRTHAEPTAAGARTWGTRKPIRMFPGYSLGRDVGDGPWEVLAMGRASTGLIVRRRLGEGEIILAGGTRWLENFTLSDRPAVPVIASLVEGRRQVVFDEAHLGIYETQGLARLTWQAGFMPAAGVLVVVAFLYVWRSASRLAPARRMPRTLDDGRVLGRDTNEGLVNLLGRSVPRAQLLGTCLREWEKTLPAARSDLQAKTDTLRRAAEPYLSNANSRSIVEGYEALRRIASERT